MPDLLIELFSEEIPARMQARACDDLKKRMTDGLVEAGLTYAGAAAFATPRRLTLALEGLLSESPTLREERKGPRVDAPEKAIEGFLRGAGVTRDALEVRDEKKGQVYFATITKPGRPAAEIVADVLDDTIRNFPWPKSMRWGAGSLRWVRPLHSILCILTDDAGEAQIVPLDVDGIKAGDSTEGHRFMAPGRFSVTSFEDYAAKLKRAHVVLNPEERAGHIWQEATNLAFARGLDVVEDKGLLQEVAGLVEWPVPLMGEIGAEFLDLPPEVLQSSMKEHQKFFSVRNPKTGRIEQFVTVANRETADQGATILAGNQKVLAARLADAKFFWENDLRIAKEGMGPWLDSLENVTFHNKLGSQAERIARIAALAREIAPVVGADPDLAEQAAQVAKADLSSEMVYEFPELQGIMGRYYAVEAGLPEDVAAACEEHYAPLGPSDAVPSRPVSVTVALADKLDTLAGFWAIDEKPTGSKDPYALRRAALGVIRLVLENSLRIGLQDKFEDALDLLRSPRYEKMRDGLFHDMWQDFQRGKEVSDEIKEFIGASAENEIQMVSKALAAGPSARESVVRKAIHDIADLWVTQRSGIEWRGEFVPMRDDLLSFFHDRLKVYLKDQGIRHDVIDACIAMEGNDDLALLVKRAQALQDVLQTEDGTNLVQGFKRANNILTQAEEKDGVEYSFGADPKFAEDDTEKALFAALQDAEKTIAAAGKDEDFARAMGAMAALRGPIDAFFEAVQINSDNEILRRNRLNMLHSIRQICLQAADLRRLDG
ncbi:glycyl-tRNA synthetase subunit beta [Roseovarius atlanticus]|uniref:Glycine--tRNA ligase beta subunit n=1 Tax=Roseovarius atlanticus TaxID=1641875 RepID=A0A0T5NTX1_9RHOB|nr:glycine--tRNA ligase subunit beta [Roseovarius atlanticus]KRS12305.1 glycyl-tRNA synthetase subunit beta [Roseovarius atlanticus]